MIIKMKFKNIFIRVIAVIGLATVTVMSVLEYLETGRTGNIAKTLSVITALVAMLAATFVSKIDSKDSEKFKAEFEKEAEAFAGDRRAEKLFYKGFRGWYGDNFATAYYYLTKTAAKANSPKAKAKAYFYIGRCALEEKKYARAEENLKKAVELDGDFAVAWNNLAGLYHITGEREKFRRTCETALIYCPFDAPLMSKLGRAYFDVAEYEKALRLFLKAEKTELSNAVYTMNSALALAALGDKDRAAESFSRAKRKGYDDCDSALKYINELLAENTHAEF